MTMKNACTEFCVPCPVCGQIPVLTDDDKLMCPSLHMAVQTRRSRLLNSHDEKSAENARKALAKPWNRIVLTTSRPGRGGASSYEFLRACKDDETVQDMMERMDNCDDNSTDYFGVISVRSTLRENAWGVQTDTTCNCDDGQAR